MIKTKVCAIVLSSVASAAWAGPVAPPSLHLRIVYSLVVPNVAEVGLRQQQGVYRIYANGPIAPPTSCEAQVDQPTAAILVSTWQRALSVDARWTGQTGVDGDTYEFTATGDLMPLKRSIWSPEPETFPGRLADLSRAMARFCQKPGAETLAVLRAKSQTLSRALVEADAHKDAR